MTDEALRIAIAKSRGWQIRFCRHCKTERLHSPIGICSDIPPDYPNDLNAMHEAEKTLPGSLKGDFIRHLLRIIWKMEYPETGLLAKEVFDLVDATARQRAEAYARTLRIWTD